MTIVETYITQNPMMAETRRSFRRFFGLGRVQKQSVRLGLITICFAFIVALILYLSIDKSIPPEFFIYGETAIFPVLGVIGFYGSIATERERRTWDILCALPVSRGQIVVGKYVGSVATLTAVWVAMLPFVLGSSIFYSEGYTDSNDRIVPTAVKLGFTFVAALVPYLTTMIALAVTLLFSARCRTSISSLCVSMLALFGWVALWPGLLAVLGLGGETQFMAGVSMNPFIVDTQILSLINPYRNGVTPISVWGICFSFLAFSLIVVVGLIMWTEKTLGFADDQVEFVRRKKNA